MHAGVEGIGDFRVDLAALANHTTKSCLNMPSWAAKAVVKIEVAKSCIKIVAPQQIDDPPPQPDAFRVGGGATQKARGLRELVVPTGGAVLGWLGALRARPVGRFRVSALGLDGRRGGQQDSQANGENAQNA